MAGELSSVVKSSSWTTEPEFEASRGGVPVVTMVLRDGDQRISGFAGFQTTESRALCSETLNPMNKMGVIVEHTRCLPLSTCTCVFYYTHITHIHHT